MIEEANILQERDKLWGISCVRAVGVASRRTPWSSKMIGRNDIAFAGREGLSFT